MPIGISDFKKLIDIGCRYVDKTLFIQELMGKSGDVFLIPRPRRFGKTLCLSMLQCFFEKSSVDNSYLFKDRKYDPELKSRGVKRILHVAMAFKGKNVLIRASKK